MPKAKQRPAIASQVARLLREERERQKISRNALSERAGLSRQMITFVEHEDRNPSLDTLLRMTEALGVSLSGVLDQAERAAKRQK